jgi:hypothetical protein
MISYNQKLVRVSVTPLDDVEAIVKRASRAFRQAEDAAGFRATTHDCRMHALTAAGIPCKRKARK